MKKYLLILLLPLLVTGCMGKEAKGDLQSTCVKVEETYNIKESVTYTLDYYKGNMKKITLNRKYEGGDFTLSINTYKTSYEKYSGVEITTNDNEITYVFDMENADEKLKEIFNLKKTYNEQVKVLKEKGFTCS